MSGWRVQRESAGSRADYYELRQARIAADIDTFGKLSGQRDQSIVLDAISPAAHSPAQSFCEPIGHARSLHQKLSVARRCAHQYLIERLSLPRLHA
jgi:hypothetical protein